MIITNQSGNMLGITSWQIIEVCDTKFVVVPTAGADKDVVQPMGRRNREYNIVGIVKTTAEEVFMMNLRGLTGSIAFSSQMDMIDASMVSTSIATPGDFLVGDYNSNDFFTGTPSYSKSYVPVLFKNVSWNFKAKRPFDTQFILKIVEIGEP